jgi:small subunit ribosomal protein S18
LVPTARKTCSNRRFFASQGSFHVRGLAKTVALGIFRGSRFCALIFQERSDMSREERSGGKGEGKSRRNDGERNEARPKQKIGKISAGGKQYLDYKETETLRRLTSANGKISGRKRSGANALEQRMIASAVKRARYMALVPYQTSAT